MPLDFPNTPTLGQQFNVGGIVWTWDGVKWTSVAPTSPTYLLTTGGTMTGAITLAGNAAQPLDAVPLQQVNAVPVTATGGTVSRTLADRFGQVIDIRDLGAACDGTTDDTAAWTAAFAKPDGTVIRVPQNCVTMVGNGAFTTNGKGISIVGDGPASIIRVRTALTSRLFNWINTGNVRVENLTIDLNNTAQPATLIDGILYFQGCNGCIVRNVKIINAVVNFYLICFHFVSVFLVENCYLQVTTASSTVQSKGIATEQSLGLNYHGRIVNNVLVNTNTNFTGANNMWIAGNDVSGWGVGAGIGNGGPVAGTSNIVIIGNRCHDTLTALDMFSVTPPGIEEWGLRVIIANNLCWKCCGDGIAVGGDGSATPGRSLVIGNSCWDNFTYTGGPNTTTGGIVMATGSDGSVVIGNNCFDSGAGTQSYGFNILNNGITDLTLADNRFSGVLGDVNRLANAAFRNTVDYVPRVAVADPTVSLGYATKQYVDSRGAGSRLLYQTTTSVGNGADLTADVLQTFTVPANTLKNVGDRIVIRAAGTFIGSTDSKTASMTWGGGASACTLTGATASAVAWVMDATFVKTGSNTQTFSSRGNTNNNLTASGTTTRAAPDTAGIVINFTGQNATNPVANSITCSFVTVDYIAAA